MDEPKEKQDDSVKKSNHALGDEPWQHLPSLICKDAQVMSSHQAAYEIGKLFALLEFHLPQAVLASHVDTSHGEITDAAFDAIGLRINNLSLNTPRKSVQRFFRNSAESWRTMIDTEGF